MAFRVLESLFPKSVLVAVPVRVDDDVHKV
jgi:hypothetical protein